MCVRKCGNVSLCVHAYVSVCWMFVRESELM